MRKIKDFECSKCTAKFEALVEDNESPICPKCQDSEHVVRTINSFGGYKINGNNSASTKRKDSGSFKRSSS